MELAVAAILSVRVWVDVDVDECKALEVRCGYRLMCTDGTGIENE
jgi:hypothetical protein